MTLITSCTHSSEEDRRPPPPTSETQHGVPSSSEPSRNVDVSKRDRHRSKDGADIQATTRDNTGTYSYQAQTSPRSVPSNSEPSRSVDVKRGRHQSQDRADSQAMAIDNPGTYSSQAQLSPSMGGYPSPCELSRCSILHAGNLFRSTK